MIFDWLRRNSVSENESRPRLDSAGEDTRRPINGNEQLPRWNMPETMMVEQDANRQARPRRLSLFERRGKIGADEFSREVSQRQPLLNEMDPEVMLQYFDQMGDMWVSECDRGHSGHLGTFRGNIFSRKVPFGQDEFSREYFDSMEDMFVAESDLGDAGYLRRNSLNDAPNLDDSSPFQRIGEYLRRPVKFGKDEFSREYARETEDFWLAKSGHEPSGFMPSGLMRRVRLGSDSFSRDYRDASNDNWLAENHGMLKNSIRRMSAAEIIK